MLTSRPAALADYRKLLAMLDKLLRDGLNRATADLAAGRLDTPWTRWGRTAQAGWHVAKLKVYAHGGLPLALSATVLTALQAMPPGATDETAPRVYAARELAGVVLRDALDDLSVGTLATADLTTAVTALCAHAAASGSVS